MRIGDQSMLAHVVERARLAGEVSETIVATSMAPADAAIAAECVRLGAPVHVGDELDVLSRYRTAARDRGADVIVRITADCPFVDPELIDRVVRGVLSRDPPIDYALTADFPDGCDVEAFTAAALECAWTADRDPASREHVTPYMLANPTLFRTAYVRNAVDLSSLRWTVDTAADLDLARAIHARLGGRSGWHDVLDAYRSLHAEPDLETRQSPTGKPGPRPSASGERA